MTPPTTAPTKPTDPAKANELGKNVTKESARPFKTEEEQSTTVDQSPSGGVEKTPIGTVSDAVHLDNTEKYVSAEEGQKAAGKKQPSEYDKQEEPILSLAQLRDYRLKHGTPPGPQADKEREQVMQLEKDILEEGAKHIRKPSAETDK